MQNLMGGRLEGKVALIAGAGSVGPGWGNGKATAVLFAREGAKVFAIDIDSKAVDETRSLIESDGGICRTYTANVVDSKQVKTMLEACVSQYGCLDILYNNVGGSAPGGAVDMPESVWDANIDLNLKSAFLCCKYSIPEMLKGGRSSIVNVSSVAGMRYLGRDMIAYHSAKGGLMEFTRAIALKYAGRGLRANTICPGLMNTPLVTARIADQYGDGDAAKVIAERDSMCPSGKMGDAWDVAYAALYLASDEAKYVNGTELVVDGGLTARCA